MGNAPAVPACLLTAKPNNVNRYTAIPGSLTLLVADVTGQTNVDSVNSKVTDTTNPSNPIAVTHSCTPTSLTFQIAVGKTYLVQFAFVQITNPYGSTAKLKEACGAVLDTIDATNLFPAYVMEA
jgi:hypothetical protein